MESWIQAYVHSFEFYGGVPALIIPNYADARHAASRYDPDLNPTHQEMAMHYDVGSCPRALRPEKKGKVESGALLARRWVIAALRHRRVHDPAELNQAIR